LKKVTSLTEFSGLGLADAILRALNEEGYTTPTPIQAATIPAAVGGRDIIGIAQTGTGKTAAFALPILNRLSSTEGKPWQKAPRVIVLAPTRELGGQILDSFRTYGRHLRLKATLAIGGVPIGKQIRALAQGVDILVATPGRLLDLTNERAVQFDRVEVLVLDEADRMLDMGFIRDIRKIVGLIPKGRQTLLFSATMPREIASLAEEMLRDPVKVAVTPAASTLDIIEQRAIRIDRAGKPALLVSLLSDAAIARAIVFTRTKHGADRVVRGLEQAGIAAEAIHGNKSQGNRDRTMNAFRSGTIRILVATDIAARGIDVDGISHVINYDLPNLPETYVHRIGRTARAGASGAAISLVSSDEMPFLRDIERTIRRPVPMDGSESNWDPAKDDAEAAAEARRGRGGNRGGGNRSQNNRPQNNRSQHNRDDRPARHAEGGEPGRGKRSGGGKRNSGQGGKGGGNRQPDNRPNRGSNGTIGDVGFMGRRPRSGGMSQGSAQ
jgi:ATP-dependent RNA helicase RhlE